MLVKCSICGQICEMAAFQGGFQKSDEMAKHETMEESKGKTVRWIILE